MKRYLLYGNHLYILAILRPLQDAIRKKGGVVAWFVPDELAPYLTPDERRLNSVDDVMAYDPAAVLVPGNVVPDFFPGIKVEVFHGFNARKRPAKRGHYRIRGFFDLYCTQGPDTTRNFRTLAEQHGFFDVVETGWPKMDPLFPLDIDPVRNDPPVVLLTSTFTPRLSAAKPLLEIVRRLSATGNYRWWVHFHPKMDPFVVEAYRGMEGENLELVETDNVIPYLQKADVMVSDTSSIVSEFLLQHKPVITLRNRRPGSHLIDIPEPEQLSHALQLALKPSDALMAAIRTYTDEIHPYRDGRSSERVLAAVDKFIDRDRQGKLRSKPANFVRRFKIRRQFNFFGWRSGGKK
jgi:hypothetical protein